MSKPEAVLQQMPWVVKQIIVDNSDTVSKLSFRQSCKDYNTVVDLSPITYEKLSIVYHCIPRRVEVTLSIDNKKDNDVEFKPTPTGYKMGNQKEGTLKEENKIDVIDATWAYLKKKIFEKPKVELKTLEMFIPPPYGKAELYQTEKTQFLEKLGVAMGSVDRKQAIETVQLEWNGNQQDLLNVLSHLEPGTLKTINMVLVASNEPTDETPGKIELAQVAQLLQWKQAEHLDIGDYFLDIPFDDWKHFNTIQAQITEVTNASFAEMVRGFIANESFSKCRLFPDSSYELKTLVTSTGLQKKRVKGGGFKVFIGEKGLKITAGNGITFEKL